MTNGIDETSDARPGPSRARQDAKRRGNMDAKQLTEQARQDAG